MARFKIRAYDIDYSVEADNLPDDKEYESEEEIDKDIQAIKDSLDKEVILTIECDEEDLDDDYICNELTEQTGWLICSFKYDIID